MGNAVCPMVASALGRCLALAAEGAAPAPLDHPVVAVPNPEWVEVGLNGYVNRACITLCMRA